MGRWMRQERRRLIPRVMRVDPSAMGNYRERQPEQIRFRVEPTKDDKVTVRKRRFVDKERSKPKQIYPENRQLSQDFRKCNEFRAYSRFPVCLDELSSMPHGSAATGSAEAAMQCTDPLAWLASGPVRITQPNAGQRFAACQTVSICWSLTRQRFSGLYSS